MRAVSTVNVKSEVARELSVENGLLALQTQRREVPAAVEAEVFKVLDELIVETRALGREFGARLCRDKSGAFTVRGRFGQFADEVYPPECPRNSDTVARFHTHRQAGMQGPSGGDIANADATPEIPFYLEHACGLIVRWIGPNSAGNQQTLRGCQ
jgi:hypothetical protein